MLLTFIRNMFEKICTEKKQYVKLSIIFLHNAEEINFSWLRVLF